MFLLLPWLSVPIFNILKYILSSLILGTLFERWISVFLHTTRHHNLLRGRKVPLSLSRGRVNRSGIVLSADKFVVIMILVTAAVFSVEIAFELGTDAVFMQPIGHVLTNNTLSYRDVSSNDLGVVPNPPTVKFAIDAATGICHNVNGNSSLYYPMHFVHTTLANGEQGVKIECPLNVTGVDNVLSSNDFISQQQDAVENIVSTEFTLQEKPAECRKEATPFSTEEFGGIKCAVDLRGLMPVPDFKVREQSWAFGGTPRPLFMKSPQQTTWCLLITKNTPDRAGNYESSIHSCVISSGGWNHVFSVWQSSQFYHRKFSDPTEALRGWNEVTDLTYITSVKGVDSLQNNLKSLLLVHRNSPEGFQRFSLKAASVATQEGWPDISTTVQREIAVPGKEKVVPAITTWIVGTYIGFGVVLILSGLCMGYYRKMSRFRDLVGEERIASLLLQQSMLKIGDMDDGDSKRRRAMLMLIKTDTGDRVTIVGD